MEFLGLEESGEVVLGTSAVGSGGEKPSGDGGCHGGEESERREGREVREGRGQVRGRVDGLLEFLRGESVVVTLIAGIFGLQRGEVLQLSRQQGDQRRDVPGVNGLELDLLQEEVVVGEGAR